MSLSVQQPRSYPAALLKKRRTLPSHFYVSVQRSSVPYICSSQQFNYDALNKSSIEAHFQCTVASSFISLYESEDTASRKRPHVENVRRTSHSYDAVMVDIDTNGMMPAWINVEDDVHIPVWFEKDSQESKEAHHEEVLWFCLEEVKTVLCMDDNLGDKGEWLAGGFIPQSRVAIHARSSNSEPPQRITHVEERYEADRQARRERVCIEDERLRLHHQDFEHMIKKAQSSRSLKTPPAIPIRQSSLSSLDSKALDEPKKEASKGSKLVCTTRNARISVTNADPRNAVSLMKYAILMAHGNKLEGEETCLSETASSAGDLDRARSTRTIENGPRRERQNGFAGRNIGTLMTPPASPKELSRRRDTHKAEDRENGDNPALRYKLAQHDDDESSQEGRRSVRRSAAPSPSQSMLGFHSERRNGSSLRPRRSRRDLLLELQSDQDSVLREYARVSLQDPKILQRARSRSRHGNANQDAASRMHGREDDQSPISLRDRLAASTSSSLVPAHDPPSSYGAHDEAQQPPHVDARAPSLYSTMTSLASISTFEHASIQEAVSVSVELASHVNEVEIVRSKNGSEAGFSSPGSSVQSRNEPRMLEVQEEAEAEATAVPDPAFAAVPLEQPEREIPLPPQPNPTPTTLSKGESFLAKAKCLGEKGREITSRIAEIKERQSKPKARKGKWDLSMWKLGEKREKNGNRQIDEQYRQGWKASPEMQKLWDELLTFIPRYEWRKETLSAIVNPYPSSTLHTSSPTTLVACSIRSKSALPFFFN